MMTKAEKGHTHTYMLTTINFYTRLPGDKLGICPNTRN